MQLFREKKYFSLYLYSSRECSSFSYKYGYKFEVSSATNALLGQNIRKKSLKYK